jgi:hypothetical protein
MMRRDSSVSKMIIYWLDGRGSIRCMGRVIPLRHPVQTDSGAHLDSYPRGTGGSLRLQSGRSVKLISVLHLQPNSIMCGYLHLRLLYAKRRDSSVGIALGYRLDDRGSRVRFPEGAGNSSLHYRVQNVSGAHPASYPMGTRVSFPGGKAVGA